MPDRNQRQSERRDSRGRAQTIEYRAHEARADADAGSVAGYLSTFWVVDSYATAMHPSCFAETLHRRGDRCPLLYQHNPDWPIGRLANLQTDATGLHHDSAIVDDGAEGTVCLKRLRGDVPFAHSFGFRTLRERQATDSDPLILGEDLPAWVTNNLPESVWIIEEVKLYEGSIVTFPANETAVIETVRTEERAQALAQTLEELRAGRLDAAGRALVAELAAAYATAAPGSIAGSDPRADPRTGEQARKDRESALRTLAAARGIPVEHFLCQTAA